MTTDALPTAEPGAPAPEVATPAWVAGFLLGEYAEYAGHGHDGADVVLIDERGRLIVAGSTWAALTDPRVPVLGGNPLPKAEAIV